MGIYLEQVPDGLKEMLGPDAPDVCIEAVGFHYMNSWLHKIESALMLETDTSEILNELIYCCRKARPSRARNPGGNMSEDVPHVAPGIP